MHGWDSICYSMDDLNGQHVLLPLTTLIVIIIIMIIGLVFATYSAELRRGGVIASSR